MQMPKEYDCVRLKDGREGTIVGVYSGDVYLVDIDYPRSGCMRLRIQQSSSKRRILKRSLMYISRNKQSDKF